MIKIRDSVRRKDFKMIHTNRNETFALPSIGKVLSAQAAASTLKKMEVGRFETKYIGKQIIDGKTKFLLSITRKKLVL